MTQPTEPNRPPEPIEPGCDPATLRDVYSDVEAARDQIEALRVELRAAPDTTAELLARGDLTDLLRGVGELDAALDQAQHAADRAEIAGTAAQQHLARLRLARVHQYRGEFVESNLLFTELVNAAGQFGPVIEAFTQQAAGSNDFDQQLYPQARERFANALAIRDRLGLADEQIAASRISVAAAGQAAAGQAGQAGQDRPQQRDEDGGLGKELA